MSDKWEFEYRKCKDFVVDKMTDEEYIAFIEREKKKIDEAIDEYKEKQARQAQEMINEQKAHGIKEEELLFICNTLVAYGLPLKHKDGENFNTLLDIPLVIDRKAPEGVLMLAQIADIAKYHAVKTFDYKAWLNEIGAKFVLVPDMKGLIKNDRPTKKDY